MAKHEIEIPIVGKDKFSDVADKVLDEKDQLEKPIEVPVDLTTEKVATEMAKFREDTAKDAESIEKSFKRQQEAIDRMAQSAKEASGQVPKVGDAAAGSASKVDKLADSSDQSRSVLANMVGNSVQDVGSLGGVAGTAGMALGQLGEYATEGGIKLANLARTAGPLIAVAAVAKLIGDRFAKIAAGRAFNVERVTDWSEALQDGATALDAMVDSYREAGKIEANFAGTIVDITTLLDKMDMTAGDFSRLVEGGTGEVDRWAISMQLAGEDTAAVQIVTAAARQAIDELAESSSTAGERTRVFADKSSDLATALGEVQTNALDAVEAIKAGGLADALEEVDIGATDAELAMQDYYGALDQSASYLGAVGQADALADSLEEVARLQREGKTDTEEYRDAQRDLAGDTGDLARTVVDLVAQYGEIPETERTAILAELPTDEQAAFDAWMRTVEAGATAPIDVTVKPGSISNALKAIRAGVAGGVTVPLGMKNPMSTTNITVNAPTGMRADDVIAAATKYARRNGGTVLQRGGRVRPGRPR